MSWKRLELLYSTSCVAATLAGSPCETFSKARWTPLVDENGMERRGPRPLRTRCASCLRAVHSLCKFFGVPELLCAISEHPAAPRDPGRATMWRMPIMQTLLYVLFKPPW